MLGHRRPDLMRTVSLIALLSLAFQLISPIASATASAPLAVSASSPANEIDRVDLAGTISSTPTDIPSTSTPVATETLAPADTETPDSTATPVASPAPTDIATETPTPPDQPTLSPGPSTTIILTSSPTIVPFSQTVGIDGGEITFPSGVSLVFPANSATEPFAVTLGPPVGPFEVHGAVLNVFGLDAQGLTSGLPKEHFDKPYTMTVSYDPNGLSSAREKNLQIDYWDPVFRAWNTISTTIDPVAHTLTASVDHFTDFAVLDDTGNGPSNVLWPQTANVENFGVALSSGSANFRYPIDLPPGPGGFAPSLNITGSSNGAYSTWRAHDLEGVNGTKAQQGGGWLGLEMQLDLPYIEYHKVSLSGGDADRYTLFLGGSSYKLSPINPSATPSPVVSPTPATTPLAYYRTESDQFIEIERWSGFWLVRTRDGTRYTLGYTNASPSSTIATPLAQNGSVVPTSSPVIASNYPFPPKLVYEYFPPNQRNYPTPTDATWYISGIDAPGSYNTPSPTTTSTTTPTATLTANKLRVYYNAFQDLPPSVQNSGSHQGRYVGLASAGGGCNDYGTSYYQAVFPWVITYGVGDQSDPSIPLVRIYFNRSTVVRGDFIGLNLRDDPCISAYYDPFALDNIEVKTWQNGAETLVRRYKFTYSNGIPLFLTGIQEVGSDNSSTLPPVSLTWSAYSDPFDNRLVSMPIFNEIDNGYNGIVSFDYNFIQATGDVDRWGGSGGATETATVPQVIHRRANPGASGESAAIDQYFAYAGVAGNNNTYEPEFRGYSQVTSYQGNASVEHHFLQGLGAMVYPLAGTSFNFIDATQMQGQEWQTITRQCASTCSSVTPTATATVLAVVERIYAAVNPAITPTGTVVQSAFVALTQEDAIAYPINATSPSDSTRSVSRKKFSAYDGYGNVGQIDEYNATGGTETKYRTTMLYYNRNSDPNYWIVDKLFVKNVLDASGVLILNDAYYYDADYRAANPPSETGHPPPMAGRVTMVRHLIRGDEPYDQTHACVQCIRSYFAYDQYGNQISAIDPNGNADQTTYAWSGRFTYPTSKSFPVLGTATATASWDLNLGSPLTSTNINGQTTSFQYDVFGRTLAIAKPGDTLSTPTVKYVYHDLASSITPIANYGSDFSSAQYARSGWTYDSSHFTLTANTSMLEFDVHTGTSGAGPPELMGRSFTAPSGQRIGRVTFDYADNYDNAALRLELDTQNQNEAWSINTIGVSSGSQSMSWAYDQAPTWIAFGLFAVGGFSPAYPWFGKITNLKIYLSTDHAVTMTQRGYPSSDLVHTDYYDGFGRVFETKTFDENSQYVTSFKSYDGNGRLLQESLPIESAATTIEQPDWGSLVKTSYVYDSANRTTGITSPTTGLTTTYYTGWKTEIVDNVGHCRATTLDPAGRVASSILYDGTATPVSGNIPSCGSLWWTHTTTYAYDAGDRLTSVTDAANNVTTMIYDGLGRKTRLSDPDMGTWSYGYDNNGNLTTQIDARGQVTFSSYDGLNRLTGVGTPGPSNISAANLNALRTQINTDRATYNNMSSQAWATPAGSLSSTGAVRAGTANEMQTAIGAIGAYRIPTSFTAGAMTGSGTRPVRLADFIDLSLWAYGSYTPSNWSPTISYSYDSGTNARGLRTGLVDPSGVSTLSYDSRGRLTQQVRAQSSQVYTTTYAYDDANALTTLAYPDSSHESVALGYNVRRLPTSSIGGSNYITSVNYTPDGQPWLVRFGDTVESRYSYFNTLLYNFSVPMKSVYRAYATDGVGNVRCIDPAAGSLSATCDSTKTSVEKFTYDAQNRLIAMGNNNAGSTVTDPDTYAYDTNGLGEIVTKTEGSVAVTLAYANSRPVHAPSSVTVNGAATSYSYDAVGNLTSRGTTTYTYDFQNHLTKVNQNGSITTFGYDGDGKLARRIDPNGTTTDYVGEIYDRSATSGGSVTETKRYYLGSRLIATRVGGTLTYLYDDKVHSTAATSAGTNVEYTPYGLVRTTTGGTLPTDRQFQGQQNQGTIGLYHMCARWYDPTIGLWTQPDSIIPNPIDPLAFNRYRFVEGNPLTYWDPSGHASVFTTSEVAPEVWINIASSLVVNEGITPIDNALFGISVTTAGPAIGPCCYDPIPVMVDDQEGYSPSQSGSSTIFAANRIDDAIAVHGKSIGEITSHILDKRTLEAAVTEMGGGSVKIDPKDKLPYQHIIEVQNGQRGLENRIDALQRQLDNNPDGGLYTRMTDNQRQQIEALLADAAKALANSYNYVPEGYRLPPEGYVNPS